MNSASPLTVSRLMAGCVMGARTLRGSARRQVGARNDCCPLYLMRSSCFTVSSTSANRTGLRR